MKKYQGRKKVGGQEEGICTQQTALKIRANPDLVRACEIEVNEQMGLQHSCQKLPRRSQQSWQHLRGPGVREMRLDLIRSRTGNAH